MMIWMMMVSLSSLFSFSSPTPLFSQSGRDCIRIIVRRDLQRGDADNRSVFDRKQDTAPPREEGLILTRCRLNTSRACKVFDRSGGLRDREAGDSADAQVC